MYVCIFYKARESKIFFKYVVFFHRDYLYIYHKLDLNTQVTYIYCASNIDLKLFLCAFTMRKWHSGIYIKLLHSSIIVI